MNCKKFKNGGEICYCEDGTVMCHNVPLRGGLTVTTNYVKMQSVSPNNLDIDFSQLETL